MPLVRHQPFKVRARDLGELRHAVSLDCVADLLEHIEDRQPRQPKSAEAQ
jgi:hypothetical protein